MSRNDHWLALLLVAVVALIYAPTSHFDYITLDDRFFHIETPQLHQGFNADTLRWALTDTAGNYWHPTWNLVNLVAFTAFGPDAGPQHVVNTVLYAAMAAGLFYTLRATTLRAAVAFVAAALWAWHPLHVENVNWLTERAGLLAAGFCIATIAAYLAYGRRRSAWRYALVALCLFLAMGAKPIYAALPVALLALDLWPLDRALTAWRERRWRGVVWLALEKVPLLVLTGAYTVSTAWLVARRAPAMQAGPGGAAGVPWVDAILAIPAAYVFTLAKTVVPTDLSIHYPWTMAWSRGQCLAALAGMVALTALIFWSRHRALIAGYLWFGIVMFPVLAAARYRTAWMADRYVIVPHILLLAGAAAAFFDATARRSRAAPRTTPVPDVPPQPGPSMSPAGGSTFFRRWGAITVALAALIALSVRQVWIWRDSEALFRHAVTLYPESETAHHCLAIALAEQDRLKEAADHYLHAVAIRPGFFDARLNLGIVQERLGNFDLSDRSLQAALQIEPNSRAARFAVARLRARQGRHREAVELYGQLVREYPNDVDVHVNFGAALEVMGDRAGAEAQYRKALRLDPNDPDARANLDDLLAGRSPVQSSATRPASPG